MSHAAAFIGVVIFSYLLGSVPCGLLLGKLRGVDVTEYGSGKSGATNVLRTLGLKAGALVLVGDVLKGVGAVLFARFVLGGGAIEVTAALAAVIGHNWSLYIKFRGGRGVATSLGGLAAMSWPVWLLTPGCLAVFIVVVALSRYVSLGSMVAALSVLVATIPLAASNHIESVYIVYGAVGAGLILFQHRDNIVRLLAGTERKLGERGERR